MAAAYTSPSTNLPPPKSATYRAPSANTTNAPQGTFLPGTKVQIGSHRVIIERYLSEGGFAHVYVVRIPRDGSKYELAVLKRVAVPDKEHLANMRTEVETMKKLKGHKHIVTYYDSHANQLKGGGYEVFLLMEFCSGGGLIDFMNTRLQHRLIEAEILKIFGDVAEGLACMHYLKPPLLHRDLKVENVLISKGGKDSAPVYKLADFGSTAPPRPAATTAEEGRLIEDDVQKHTTMQYRSPEMIDVWRKRPIDEKADIWAMGVFLYKLCYYTTPFEEVGQMAILNASFKYPPYPQFSDRLKKLIGVMLKEDPNHRPNIYQVIKEVSSMRGTPVPIKDIYSDRTRSETRRNEVLPTSGTGGELATIGLKREAVTTEQQSLPDVAPMRRGRPTTQQVINPKPNASPAAAAADPFAALDSKNFEVRAGAVDELSKRFPSLDDFTITQGRAEPFQFDAKSTSSKEAGVVKSAKVNLSERVTNALADEAFAAPKRKIDGPVIPTKPGSTSKSMIPQQLETFDKPLPPRTQAAGSRYVSTATGTSPPDVLKSNKPPPEIKLPKTESKPIWKVPSSHQRSTSQPRASPESQAVAASLQPNPPPIKKPGFLGMHRSKSQTPNTAAAAVQEQEVEALDHSLLRSQTVQPRSRPSSVYVASNLDFLRNQENARKTSTDYKRSADSAHQSRQPSPRLIATEGGEFAVVDNDLDFLQSKEEDGTDSKQKGSRKGSGGLSFGHRKRNSLPSISGATKDIFKGRFGDALKRFEPGSGNSEGKTPTDEPKTPYLEEQETVLLSPIAGSDATPSKHSDDTYSPDIDPDELPPDVRREMERRRLSQEEQRVAEAARHHRERVATNGTGGPPISRGTAIQQRVQTLLDEGSRSSSPVKRTAEGYGHFTDTHEREESKQQLPTRASSLNRSLPPIVAKKPASADQGLSYQRTRPAPAPEAPQASPPIPSLQAQRAISRPSAPPKPKVFRGQWQPIEGEGHAEKPLPATPTGGLAALLAKDLEGVPDYPAHPAAVSTSVPKSQQDDLEAEFSKRYPSLSGIEMVERDFGGASQGRMKEI